jgi:hypothetical protein
MRDTDGLLSRVRARLAVASALEDLQRGAAAGGIVLAVLVAIRATGWWRPDLALIGLAALATLLIFPLIGMFLRRYDRRALASRADRALGLEERVSTSVWVERSGGESPLASLVVEDAADSASHVTGTSLRDAFRARVLRRPLATAAVAVAAAGVLYFVQPPVTAGETPAEKAARLADEDRIADVARRMAEAAKRVKDASKKEKLPDLERVAAEIQRQTETMARTPPRREAALRKLNELSDLARDAARRRAGASKPASDPEAARTNRELAELLKQMSQVGLESLERDLKELQERMDKGADSGSPPSAAELRAMAARVDALRRAMEAAEGAGADELREKLRSIGNEDLLQQIAEQLRQLAAKMDQEGYESLQGQDAGGEAMDLSELSREELEELLQALKDMQSMQELEEMLRQGGGEMSGGRRLRLGGSGGT